MENVEKQDLLIVLNFICKQESCDFDVQHVCDYLASRYVNGCHVNIFSVHCQF